MIVSQVNCGRIGPIVRLVSSGDWGLSPNESRAISRVRKYLKGLRSIKLVSGEQYRHHIVGNTIVEFELERITA